MHLSHLVSLIKWCVLNNVHNKEYSEPMNRTEVHYLLPPKNRNNRELLHIIESFNSLIYKRRKVFCSRLVCAFEESKPFFKEVCLLLISSKLHFLMLNILEMFYFCFCDNNSCFHAKKYEDCIMYALHCV